jgi:hypothetical protein
MRKEGWAGFFEALGDVLREVSPIVRAGIVLGFLAGLGVVGYLTFSPIGDDPTDSSLLFARRLVLVIWIAIILAGGFLGLLAGTVVELIWHKFRQPPPGRRPRRAKR